MDARLMDGKVWEYAGVAAEEVGLSGPVVMTTFRHAEFADSLRIAVGNYVERSLETHLVRFGCRAKFLRCVWENNTAGAGMIFRCNLRPWVPFSRSRVYDFRVVPWWLPSSPDLLETVFSPYVDWWRETLDMLVARDSSMEASASIVLDLVEDKILNSGLSSTIGEVLAGFTHSLVSRITNEAEFAAPVSYAKSPVNDLFISFSRYMLESDPDGFCKLVLSAAKGESGVGWCFVASSSLYEMLVVSLDKKGRWVEKRVDCRSSRIVGKSKVRQNDYVLAEILSAEAGYNVVSTGYFTDILRCLLARVVPIMHLGDDRGGTSFASSRLGLVSKWPLQILPRKQESFEPVQLVPGRKVSVLEGLLLKNRAQISDECLLAANRISTIQAAQEVWHALKD